MVGQASSAVVVSASARILLRPAFAKLATSEFKGSYAVSDYGNMKVCCKTRQAKPPSQQGRLDA